MAYVCMEFYTVFTNKGVVLSAVICLHYPQLAERNNLDRVMEEFSNKMTVNYVVLNASKYNNINALHDGKS
jgi:hypothetical protein